MEVNCFCLRFSSRPIDTYDFLLEIRWLPIEDVHGLHAVVDHPQSAIEETHEVTTSVKIGSDSIPSPVIQIYKRHNVTHLVVSPLSLMSC